MRKKRTICLLLALVMALSLLAGCAGQKETGIYAVEPLT